MTSIAWGIFISSCSCVVNRSPSPSPELSCGRSSGRSTSNSCSAICGTSELLTPPPDASQLGVEKARLGRGTRRRVGRHRRRWRRIELCQDALEALDPWREGIALTVDRATHKAHNFGVFFVSKIGLGHWPEYGNEP